MRFALVVIGCVLVMAPVEGRAQEAGAPNLRQLFRSDLAWDLSKSTTPAALVALSCEPRRAAEPGARPRFLAARLMEAAALGFAAFAFCYAAGDFALAAVRDLLEDGEVRAAQEEYEVASAWLPPGASADLWYSRVLAEAAQRARNRETAAQAWQAAVDAAVRAARRSEVRHNAFYHLATLHAMENDVERTEGALRAVIAWAPHWFKPHWMLARLLNASGRKEEAKEEARTAASLNPADREVGEIE